MGSSSPTRDQSPVPCIGSSESQPLDTQGSPPHSTSNLATSQIESLQWFPTSLQGKVKATAHQVWLHKPRHRIKEQRHHSVDKGPSSQSYGFSSSHVWTWELDHKEGWSLKNWRFWTVVLEKTLESPLDSKIKQSILNIHWKDWCWSWSSNTLATWCEEPTHWKKILLLGKTEGKRKRWLHRMRCLDRITDSMDMNLSKLQEIVKDRGAWQAAVNGVPNSWTPLNNWTTINMSDRNPYTTSF